MIESIGQKGGETVPGQAEGGRSYRKRCYEREEGKEATGRRN